MLLLFSLAASPLFISLKVALIATFITTVLGIPIAYGMANYRGRGSTAIDGILLLPLVLPPTVIGFCLLWLLGNQGPLAFVSIPIVFTWWAAVLTAVVVAFPLMYRSSRAAFSQVDTQMLAAARVLGASEWRTFRQIAVPLAAPGILSGVLLSFARALGEFGATLMLAGNIPGKTQTLPMAVYFAVEGGDFATATRWSVVMGAIALATVFLSNILSSNASPLRAIGYSRKSVLHSPQFPLSQERKFPQSVALTVDISKKLPGFTLRARFSTQANLVGILGASGAGKSLLLRCLAGIERPDTGRIVLGDRILFDSQTGIDVPSHERAVSLLFQHYALFPHLNVAENIAFGIQSRTDSRQIVAEELAAVQMSDYAQAYPHQLSGGQQQRVALARALATRPQLLLLDEPLSALDMHLRSQLSQQLFQRLHRYGGNALLVSHSFEEIYRAEELLIMHQGESIQQATPKAIFEMP
ncbi:MAG: molybdate ABC transporter permease subunit, partial [Cyanobacteria bacterium J06632_3]